MSRSVKVFGTLILLLGVAANLLFFAWDLWSMFTQDFVYVSQLSIDPNSLGQPNVGYAPLWQMFWVGVLILDLVFLGLAISFAHTLITELWMRREVALSRARAATRRAMGWGPGPSAERPQEGAVESREQEPGWYRHEGRPVAGDELDPALQQLCGTQVDAAEAPLPLEIADCYATGVDPDLMPAWLDSTW